MTANIVEHSVSIDFKQFIEENADRLPLHFEIDEGIYGSVLGGARDFSVGEKYRLESIDHLVNVTFSEAYSISSERGLITIPLEFNGFFRLIPDRKGGNRSFKTMKEIASDLPCIAYPTHDIKIKDTSIPKGTEMEFTKRVQFKPQENVYLLCKCHYGSPQKAKTNHLLGIDTKANFEQAEKLYTLKELLHKMPVKAFYVSKTLGYESEKIPGLPENFSDPLFLSKVDVGICRPVVDTSVTIRIPAETELTVKKINLLDDHFNPTRNIQDIIKHEIIFPICVEVVDFDDALRISTILRDLQPDQLLIVEAVDEVEKVLTKGKGRYFTVPTENYKGKFKMVPNVFQTADEIWQEHYTKKVRVMEDYIVSSPHIDSIFAGDVLTAKEMKVISYEQQECEVIICSRESAIPELPTLVRIPSYALGGFEEVDYHKESFTLDSIPRELPISARLHGNPYQRKHNEDDKLLLEEAPLTFEVIFTEMNILVSVFDEIKNSTTHRFFIPEHKLVRVKKRNMPTGYKPRSHHNQKERLMIDLLSEKDFNSMCVTYREYQKPPQIPPPIPPRQSTLPRRQTNRASYKSSDSEDDDYEMPFVARENSHKEPVDKK
ncbi:uncharacterized protein LOC117118273 isoform X1 [Anneissia japonica]|uniref:uncharacterized protein LOC117118273 isoform X1 n=1 Tax=Anneissia japonica TaxID=1529436 RepID=UPI0014258CE6|nr:uncharacterized protein LOC117118273 isoform X1 [Anneissia japonica]